MSTKIICTSSGCIEFAPERYRNLGIDIIRLHVIFEGHDYLEGFDLDNDKFYSKLETLEDAKNNLPKTSMPSAEAVKEVLDRTVADGFDDVSAVAVSSDKWILYIGDRRRGCIYQAPILSDGTLAPVRIFGPLHTPMDFRLPGAFDLCVDQDDRLYAATELGIQILRSGGFVDVILDNPENTPADRIWLTEDSWLYARCGEVTFRRKLRNKKPASSDQITPPQFLGYGDPQAPV